MLLLFNNLHRCRKRERGGGGGGGGTGPPQFFGLGGTGGTKKWYQHLHESSKIMLSEVHQLRSTHNSHNSRVTSATAE